MKRKAGRKSKTLQEELAQEPEFDFDKIYSYQRKLQLLYESAKQKNTLEYFFPLFRSFAKLKYRQNIFKINEILQLYEPTQTKPYIVKLLGIYRFPDEEEVAYALKVEWLLRKTDLPLKKYSKYLQHISIAEVFPSRQIDYVPIESIMRKSDLIKYEQYENLTRAGDNIYFSRANYNPDDDELVPDPSKWQKACSCSMPINPDLEYTQCQGCERWYHNKCINDEVEENQKFVCHDCQ